MSTENKPVRRMTAPAFAARKGAGGVASPLVCLTACTSSMAGLLDPHCDLLLVGDSVGMVVYGLPSTLNVSLRMMIDHGAAVVRGSSRALVVVDLPFASYQESPQQAFRNAAQVMQETACGAVKLEGGAEMAETIRFLGQRGVPVMGHVGLTPQAVNTLGGYRARGRAGREAEKIRADAIAVAQAGAFALVVEGVMEPLARELTGLVDIPVIGIGASPACDGQVLVTEDMLGMFPDFTPKFVHQYGQLAGRISDAAAAYAADVRARAFPRPENLYGARPVEQMPDSKGRKAGSDDA